jgi:hypothetical protein
MEVTKFVWNFPPAKTSNCGNSPQNAGKKQELSVERAPGCLNDKFCPISQKQKSGPAHLSEAAF